ncbi:MAG: RNA methyltransferase [Chloroflexi bacterium]|nr:RNA methyltransferase [Chloroflexota bacterium]
MDAAASPTDAPRVLKCTNPACGLRFPDPRGEVDRCPRCGAAVRVVGPVLPWQPEPAQPPQPLAATRAVVLDNLRSAWNVGAVFRIADAAGFGHLFLTGITPTPPHPRIAKVALGAERSVPWSYHPDAVLLAQQLREKGWTLWALEVVPEAATLPAGHLPPPEPWAWLIGNEVTGLDPELLALAHAVWRLPMRGRKRSLNAAMAFAAAAYRLQEPEDK